MCRRVTLLQKKRVIDLTPHPPSPLIPFQPTQQSPPPVFCRRGYSTKKVGENVECEIMQIVLEEAKEAYPDEAVHEVQSNSVEELESNCSRVEQWLDTWRSNNPA